MKAKWLRERRKELNISQEELAARLQIEGVDFTAGTISHWENGRYNPPLEDPEFRHALAVSLRLSIRSLLSLAGYEVVEQSRTEAGERAAFIMDQLPPDKQNLALGILEKFLDQA
jgi:transcriptional regulator with XRE-family HTH domain